MNIDYESLQDALKIEINDDFVGDLDSFKLELEEYEYPDTSSTCFNETHSKRLLLDDPIIGSLPNRIEPETETTESYWHNDDEDFTPNSYTCFICNHQTNDRIKIIQHIKRKHNCRRKCNICCHTSIGKHSLNHHILKHKKEKLFTCELCAFITNSKPSIIHHIITHESYRRYKCNLCDFGSNLLSGLRAHMRVHIGEKSFTCYNCGYQTMYKDCLARHVQQHTGTYLRCYVCQFETLSKDLLIMHIQRHAKKYSCRNCEYCTLNKKCYKGHLLTHTKPYACEICAYRSSRTSEVRNHMVIAHEKAIFNTISCYYCDYKCDSKGRLTQHIRWHRFKCRLCEYNATLPDMFGYRKKDHECKFSSV